MYCGNDHECGQIPGQLLIVGTKFCIVFERLTRSLGFTNWL